MYERLFKIFIMKISAITLLSTSIKMITIQQTFVQSLSPDLVWLVKLRYFVLVTTQIYPEMIHMDSHYGFVQLPWANSKELAVIVRIHVMLYVVRHLFVDGKQEQSHMVQDERWTTACTAHGGRSVIIEYICLHLPLFIIYI